MKNSKRTAIHEENHLKVLRLLEQNPTLSQRDLAEVLGISVGKTNYCIRALVDKGLVKINNFRNHKNKLVYSYLLTPAGIIKKTDLTIRFLYKKNQEYEILKKEIELLKKEIENQSQSTIN